MQENKNIKIIGIGGLARAGKDTFVAIAINILKRNGYSPFRIAFADKLKSEMETMLLANNFKATVYTDDSAAKKLIRPLMVWWGCQRRYDSEDGLYWIKQAEEKIKYYQHSNLKPDKLIFLVSDVRFSNEANWIYQIFDGDLIHLRKYTTCSIGIPPTLEFHKVYDEPPNEEEKRQDPLVQELAKQRIDWEKSSSSDIVNDPTLNKIVLNALNNTKYFRHTSIGTLL